MKTIIHPTYFPNIEFFSHLIKSDYIIFEVNDNYQKQTLRNRTSIYSSNGKLDLSIPVKFSSSNKEKLRDIKICYNSNWQKRHLKSIQTAYRSSPYFSFFEEYFFEIFEKKEKYLIDVSLKSIEIIYQILEVNLNYKFTNEYKRTNKAINDSRELSRRNKTGAANSIKQYHQVFEENHGFIKNLSMIDLIFNQGIGSLDFFEKSNI
tara:strand:- start:113 stop:730 length:618 start_codon:yes stop_codon:yes gene_type:complete